LLSCGGCPPRHRSSSPGPHCCCCLSVSSCPVVFVVAAPLLFCRCVLRASCLFPPREQLLAAVGCWWPSSSLPRHPSSLPRCPCRRTLPCFVGVLIHHPPHEQVLVAVASFVGVPSWHRLMVNNLEKANEKISQLKIKGNNLTKKILPRAQTTCHCLGPMWLVCGGWWR
jgi:hypothetical protein